MGRKLNLHRVVKGEIKPITSREAKAYIMRVNKWSEETYNKQRYILKNKLRTYEAFQKASGKDVKEQSPVELLYKTARAKQRQGADYKPSLEMRRIQAFTSVGSQKAIEKSMKGRRYKASAESRYQTYTGLAFANLIESNPKAKEIFFAIKDPVKREQALIAFAKKLHAVQDEEGRIQESAAIPFGEVTGSDTFTEFEYNEYL